MESWYDEKLELQKKQLIVLQLKTIPGDPTLQDSNTPQNKRLA